MEEFFTRLNEFHKKYSRYFLMLLLIVAVFIGFKALPFLITLFLPFVIAWGVSFAASPLTKFMKHKLHLPYRVCGITTVLLLIGLLGLIVSMVFSFITWLTVYISDNWNYIVSAATEYVNMAYKGIESFIARLPVEVGEFFRSEEVVEAFSLTNTVGQFDIWGSVSSILTPFATGTISIVMSLPETIIFLVILIMSTYFISSKREKFFQWYRSNMPENFVEKMHILRVECFGAIMGTLKAQIILMFITMAELFVGFLILGIEKAGLLALVVAIVDVLPILGVGTVLIPWSIIEFLASGNIYKAVGIISLYFICLAVRNLLQPKIVGKSIGIGSLTTLVSIWVGYKLYGFLGMLIMPIIATILYKIYDVGLLDWFFLSHKKVTEERERLALEKAEGEKEAKEQ